MDVSKPQLLLKRVINVKAIVTPFGKTKFSSNCKPKSIKLTSSCNSWTFKDKERSPKFKSRVYNLPVLRHCNKSIIFRVRLTKEERLLEQKNQSLQNLQQVQFLELDQEVNQFQMEGFFRVEPGDNLISKLQVEVVLRDGVVEEIRGDI